MNVSHAKRWTTESGRSWSYSGSNETRMDDATEEVREAARVEIVTDHLERIKFKVESDDTVTVWQLPDDKMERSDGN